MVAQAGCDIHIIVRMMNKMKSPKGADLMHYPMNKPTAEIQREDPDNYSKKNIGIEPVNKTK